MVNSSFEEYRAASLTEKRQKAPDPERTIGK